MFIEFYFQSQTSACDTETEVSSSNYKTKNLSSWVLG